MGGGRLGQSDQIIAALQHADEAVVATAPGDIHQFARRPIEIGFLEVDLGQRVAVMGIEAGST